MPTDPPHPMPADQLIVPEMEIPPAFEWDHKTCSLKQFVENYHGDLPQILKVTSGYSGPGCVHSFTPDEVIPGSSSSGPRASRCTTFGKLFILFIFNLPFIYIINLAAYLLLNLLRYASFVCLSLMTRDLANDMQ